MRIMLMGFGVVGRGFVTLLRDKRHELRTRYGFEPRVVGVATRSAGAIYHPDGLDLDALLATGGDWAAYPTITGAQVDASPDAARTIIHQVRADVLVDATPTDLTTGGAALRYALEAFEQRMHVVLASKGAVAVAYDDLQAAAARAGTLLRFEGAVMAGTPSIRLAMQALAGCRIDKAMGILNGTTNYILTRMEGGMSYLDALAQAQQLGYAETDPTADVEGWDAAGKAIILGAALFNARLSLGAMPVRGITALTPADIDEARAAGERWKLIATVTPGGARVEPVRLPLVHPLASVADATNAITYTTDLLGDVTLIGPGAGATVTGFALLSDLLDIHRTFGERR